MTSAPLTPHQSQYYAWQLTRQAEGGSVASLEEKLHWQKRQRELEAQRSKQHRELFERQDEIEAQRNKLIDELEGQLQQRVEKQELFVIEWDLA